MGRPGRPLSEDSSRAPGGGAAGRARSAPPPLRTAAGAGSVPPRAGLPGARGRRRSRSRRRRRHGEGAVPRDGRGQENVSGAAGATACAAGGSGLPLRSPGCAAPRAEGPAVRPLWRRPGSGSAGRERSAAGGPALAAPRGRAQAAGGAVSLGRPGSAGRSPAVTSSPQSRAACCSYPERAHCGYSVDQFGLLCIALKYICVGMPVVIRVSANICAHTYVLNSPS